MVGEKIVQLNPEGIPATVSVCLSPALIGTFNISNKIVVVIDVLRATTSMCVAFDYGIDHIVPVASIEECAKYHAQGYLCAAERNGVTVDGFEMGNSPFSYMNPDFRGKKIALTTTNGTQAIEAAKDAGQIIIGSFANITRLSEYLLQQGQPVMLLCSGWKNKPNLEDSIFAGAVIDRLRPYFQYGDDAAVMAHCLYDAATDNKRAYIEFSHHYVRLLQMNLQKDVKYCLRQDTHPVLPVYHEGKLIDLTRSSGMQMQNHSGLKGATA